MTPKKVFVDSGASKRSQDEGTNFSTSNHMISSAIWNK